MFLIILDDFLVFHLTVMSMIFKDCDYVCLKSLHFAPLFYQFLKISLMILFAKVFMNFFYLDAEYHLETLFEVLMEGAIKKIVFAFLIYFNSPV